MNRTAPPGERPRLCACPLCSHEHLDYQFTHGGTPVVSCAGCGLLMRNPQPSDTELNEMEARRGTVGNEPVAGTGNDRPATLDLIERARSPLAALGEIRHDLPPGGRLHLTVPDLDRRAARLKSGRLEDIAPDHLFFFDRQTVQSLLFRAGFEQVTISKGGAATEIVARRTGGAPPIVRSTRLTVVMPVFNERDTFLGIFEQVYAKTLSGVDIDIMVVESNSTDGTRELVQKIETRPRVTVIYEDRPRGKGHAVRAGLARASGDLVLIQDADLEYDVDDYDQLVEPLVTGRAAFVLGIRHGMDGKTWKMRHFADQVFVGQAMNVGHLFFTGLFNVVYGQRMRDPFTMFKVFRRDCLYGLIFESNRFDFDWELVAKLVRAGYAPLEIPVNYSSRSFSKGKKVSLWRDPWTFLRACFKYRFVSLGK
jgi:hypothetical protein